MASSQQVAWKVRLKALVLTADQKGAALAELVKLGTEKAEDLVDDDPEIATAAVLRLIGAAYGLGFGNATGAVTTAEVTDLRIKVEALMKYFPFLVSKALLWRDGSIATHSKSEKGSMTSALKGELHKAGVKGCQLLGDRIPKEFVSLAHLCKLSWADGTCHLLGLSKDDVSSLRNALLLSKPIERAFDNSAVCFYKDPEDKQLKLHIIWDELKSQKLCDCKWLGGTVDRAKLADVFGDKTYGDLEAQPLNFYDSKVVPFYRVLSTHAQLSLDRAVKAGKTAQSWIFQDYRSTENVVTWLNNAELQEPPAEVSLSESSEVNSISSALAAL